MKSRPLLQFRVLSPAIVALFLFLQFSNSAAEQYSVGVYYYPGWKDVPEEGQRAPWTRIERAGIKPLLGFYPEGDREVMTQQLRWIAEYKIDYLIFDWYWKADVGPRLTHAIDAYLKMENREGVGFSLLWANHSDEPSSLADFDHIVAYWMKNYLADKSFFRMDGKPVIYVFDPKRLEKNAKKFGSSTKELFERANLYARKFGVEGIYFIGSSQAVSADVQKLLPESGYSAVSAYNYHTGYSGFLDRNKRFSHSYPELDGGYQESWKWILQNSSLPYVIPVTSGWNKTPWGGSSDADHDRSISTPGQFEEHLQRAKSLILKYPSKSKGVAICCWNEYGEGSYVEPTQEYGFSYLKAVAKVFGDRAGSK